MVDVGEMKIPLPPTPGKTQVVTAVEGKLTKPHSIRLLEFAI